jgi:hypothetical protein
MGQARAQQNDSSFYHKKWIAEVIETADAQRAKHKEFQAIMMTESEDFILGPRGCQILEYLHEHKEEREVFLAAMRLGGIKRAAEMFEAQHDFR